MANKKIMFVDWRNDFFLHVIDKVSIDSDNEVLHITEKSFFKKHKNINITFIDQLQFDRPEFIFNINTYNSLTISKSLVDSYLKCESIFLSLIDRYTYFSISVQKRKRLYYELLLYWENFFDKNKIELVCFPTAPHMGYDYVLYEVARKRGINTFVLERTLFNDRLIVKEDIYDTTQVPIDYLKDLTIRELKENLNEFFLKQAESVNNYWIDYSKKINASVVEKSKISKLFTLFNRIFQNNKNILTLFTPLRISAIRYDQCLPRIFIHLISLYENKKTKVFRLLYESNVSKIDYESTNYIYLPLHFQPERSTEPLGDIFQQQELIVKLLSAAIPTDWKIVIKEHPRQFDHTRINSVHYRDESFYNNLLKDKKVIFSSLDTPSEYLTIHSKMVATITGSSGWDGIINGKEVLLFGCPWYIGCRNSYFITSVDDCKEAIMSSLKKNEENKKTDLLKYLIYMKNDFVISTNDDRFAINSEIKYDKLVSNLVFAILNKLK